MDEIWVVIEEFPNYHVSDHGRVLNADTGRILAESRTKTGTLKIGLVMGGKQYTRSVCVLVAEAFVEGRSEVFNTPIHLDGNPQNNFQDNLIWRPRWFAWKYARQFREHIPGQSQGPIVDTVLGGVYVDMWEAALSNGLLVEDVWKSVHSQKPTFPTWQMFVFK